MIPSHHKVLLVIPAKREDTEFSRKLLMDATGKPLLYYTWKNAMQSELATDVVIATDSEEIMQAMTKLGAKCTMTSSQCLCGTDRLLELLASGWIKYNIYVSLHGNEATLTAGDIDACIERLIIDKKAEIATLAAEFPDNDGDVEHRYYHRVKVQVSAAGYAQNFFRAVPPYQCYRHIGIYAYRKRVLARWRTFPRARAQHYSLEQLAPIDEGIPIAVEIVQATPPGINTKEDYEDFVTRLSYKPMSEQP